MSLTVIGIDPGVKNTGYAALTLQKRHKSIVASGKITTPSDWPLTERIRVVVEELCSLKLSLEARGFFLTAAAIEDQFLFIRKRRQGITDTIKMEGAIIGWALLKGLKVTLPTPVEWQSLFLVKGKGRKEQVRKALEKQLGREIDPHESDAVALSLYALRRR